MKFVFLMCLICASCFASLNEPVLYVTFYKGGTHLLHKALRLMTEEKVPFLNDIDSFLQDPALYCDANKSNVFGCHFFPELNVLVSNQRYKLKKIVFLRDPRDVVIAQTHWMSWIHKNLKFESWGSLCLKDFVQLSLFDQITEVLQINYNLSFPSQCANALWWMQDPEVLVCRFEDLVGPRGGGCRVRQRETLKKISDYIGCPLTEDRIEEVADALFGDTYTFRKGRIGSWKETLTPFHKDLVKHLFGEELIRLGYETDFNW